ncbi:MAG: FAD-dependent oxidoreductase [Kiritimatiellaeota bacterium]|nr:FAD-dependent oxidoreductase [Kiritimatiellota bacterium]
MTASKLRVVIIGGVAAGPKTASKIVRLCPRAEVTVVEKGEFLSYAGCGLPYYISGVVKEQKELMCSPIGVVRDPAYFQKVKNVTVLNRTEALEIDRAAKRVRVRELATGKESRLPYDRLVLATGATPVRPPIPGADLDGVYSLHGVEDAEGIRAALARRRALDVVVIGGGLIGVEVTEALVERGCRVTVVEMLPQILPMLDWEMAHQVRKHMESHGVRVLTHAQVTAIKAGTDGGGRVGRVCTTRGDFSADMAIMAVGVRPNAALAKAAGIEIGETGAIRVDEHMRTSDPAVFAVGDCAECRDLVTGKPVYVPLGSTANKQGRVAAMNVCGVDSVFPGVLGSSVCKVFDFTAARTGLSFEQAVEARFDPVTVLAPAPDRAHFMPTAKLLMLKLIADRSSRRLLGVQAVGPGDAAKRVDVAAMAVTAGLTVDDVAGADLCYAPPYSAAMDNIITAANVMRNKLDGFFEGVTPEQLKRKMDAGDEFFLLDVRTPQEVAGIALPGAVNIPLGALRGRTAEVPRDKEIITFCKISLRGYEAALILNAAGFRSVKVLDGGIVMWPYETLGN